MYVSKPPPFTPKPHPYRHPDDFAPTFPSFAHHRARSEPPSLVSQTDTTRALITRPSVSTAGTTDDLHSPLRHRRSRLALAHDRVLPTHHDRQTPAILTFLLPSSTTESPQPNPILAIIGNQAQAPSSTPVPTTDVGHIHAEMPSIPPLRLEKHSRREEAPSRRNPVTHPAPPTNSTVGMPRCTSALQYYPSLHGVQVRYLGAAFLQTHHSGQCSCRQVLPCSHLPAAIERRRMIPSPLRWNPPRPPMSSMRN